MESALKDGELDRLHRMFGDDIGPYAKVGVAPFHAPIAADEVARYVLKAGAPAPRRGELDLGSGWVLSAFSWTHRDYTRIAAWGWVSGLLAIDERHSEDDQGSFMLARVTHLPTGLRILATDSAEAAALAVACIETAVDWSLPFHELRNMRDRIFGRLLNAGWERDGYFFKAPR